MLSLKLPPEQWWRLRGLLDQALERPEAERLAWVETLDVATCGDLKPRLRSLLAGQGEARMLATLPQVETGQFAPRPGVAAEAPGATIGPYRLLRELGSGGMASVWLAERTDMLQGRQVALKLPHGAWRRAGLAERLAREREILATLEHPNIARLYDAGVTESGQPYLALEVVQGRRIDEHCTDRKLDVPARARLFLQVARAVAHAHAHLVVHRDLKPGNILVDEAGQVKLLDFGIAKLLDQGQAIETELTRLAGRALTPAYAAPEQLQGQAVGTPADVYALGVVLYELLVGARPVPGEARRPSAAAPRELRAALRGDLDTVLLKALKPDPGERYATAAALADDIERYLAHRPVLAQPDSAAYRMGKFLRRHRLAASAGAAVLAAVLAGAAAALWQAEQARAERDQALLQQRRAEAYSAFMRMLVQDSVRAGKPLGPRDLVDRGVAMLERQVGSDDAVVAHIWYELSRFHLLFAQRDRELEMLARSADAARRVGDQALIAASECSAAWTLLANGRAEGRARLQSGLAALARATSEAAASDCLRAKARAMQLDGRAAEAAAEVEASALWRSRGEGAARTRVEPLRTQMLNLYRSLDRPHDALAMSQEFLQAVRDSGRQGSLAELVAMSNHASTLALVGEYGAAAQLHLQALGWLGRPDSADFAPTGLRSGVSFSLLRMGQPERALELARTDLQAAKRSGEQAGIVIAQLGIARAQIALNNPAEAEAAIDAAEAATIGQTTLEARLQQAIDIERTELLLHRRRVDAARERITRLLAGAGYPGPAKAPAIEKLLLLAARIELAAGDGPRAEALASAALDAARAHARSDDSSGNVGWALWYRAQARQLAGRAEEARADLRLALPALRNGLGEDHRDTRQAQAMLEAPASPR